MRMQAAQPKPWQHWFKALEGYGFEGIPVDEVPYTDIGAVF